MFCLASIGVCQEGFLKRCVDLGRDWKGKAPQDEDIATTVGRTEITKAHLLGK